MSDTPIPPEVLKAQQEHDRKERVGRIVSLVKEVQRLHETMPFFGIPPDVYENIKRDVEEFPGYTTPIDEILRRCNEEGIKIVLSDTNPNSGNVFVLPANSDNIMEDSLLLENLKFDEQMPEALKQLLELKK